MRQWMIWSAVFGTAFAGTATKCGAVEPTVHNFDGWKIVIQPGPSRFAEKAPVSSIDPSKLPVIRPASYLAEEAGPKPDPVGVPPSPEAFAQGPTPGLSPDAKALQAPTPAPESVPPTPAPDGLPVITPGEPRTTCCDTEPAVSPPEGTVDPRYLSQMYYSIYKSIPFIRAEYDANPSYIHDTSVEFLFGKMRPTVVHRGTVNVNQSSPYSYGYPTYGYGNPYGYGGYGYGGFPFGYAYPPLQLVVPGTGLRIHRLN